MSTALWTLMSDLIETCSSCSFRAGYKATETLISAIEKLFQESCYKASFILLLVNPLQSYMLALTPCETHLNSNKGSTGIIEKLAMSKLSFMESFRASRCLKRLQRHCRTFQHFCING